MVLSLFWLAGCTTQPSPYFPPALTPQAAPRPPRRLTCCHPSLPERVTPPPTSPTPAVGWTAASSHRAATPSRTLPRLEPHVGETSPGLIGLLLELRPWALEPAGLSQRPPPPLSGGVDLSKPPDLSFLPCKMGQLPVSWAWQQTW